MAKKNLRQKTYGVFIKPYVEYGGDRLVQRGNLSVVSPCKTSSSTTTYLSVMGGEPYMLNYTSTSYVEIRIRVKELMNELGYSIDDIYVTEIIPINHIVTPIA